MSNLMKSSIYVLFLAQTVSAHASEASGPVSEIWSSPTSNYVMFKVDDASARNHRCNTSQRYSIDTSKPGGRLSLDILIQAKASDWVVSVVTLNTCNPFDAENVRNLVVR